MSVTVKICGLTDEVALQAAVQSGAAYAGFVFYPPSPRALNTEAARKLVVTVPDHVKTVGLFVDPSDEQLLATLKTVSLGMIQLHGQETPQRVKDIRALTGLPAMKAIGIGTAEDFAQASAYEDSADMLLFDAKPSAQAKRPGGNAESFDWSLLKGRRFKKPWLLAGGIDAGNLAAAVKASGATGVDVSSGVEDSPGRKNPEKIRELLALARRL